MTGGIEMRRMTTTCIGVALALTFGMATKAEAACVPGGGTPNAGPFCIDGVITSTDNSGVAPQALFTPDPGSGKEFGPINGSNTKVGVINFNTPPPAILGDTSITPKVNLTGVFTQAAVQGTDFWFYFAWNRATTSGSGFLAVEFERAAKPVICSTSYGPPIDPVGILGCNPWANRAGDGTPQNSDFLILWDQTGNTIGPQNISVRFYNTALAAFGPPQDVSSAGAAVAVYGNGDSSKGEMALNFTAIVQGGNTQCLTFANIIPTTVTGNSDTADYKDTVLSNFPVASNCGIVTVKKVTVPAESPATTTFGYTLADGTPMFGVAAPDSDCDGAGSNLNTCIGSLKHNETDTIQDLLAGAGYSLVESTLPSTYSLFSIICTPEGGNPIDVTAGPQLKFPVTAGKTTACVITNNFLKTTPLQSTLQATAARLWDQINLTSINPNASDAGSATVTFKVYTPSGGSDCGTLVTTIGPLSLTYGPGGTTASASTLSTVGILMTPGTKYSWIVEYSGDALNNPVTTSCGQESAIVAFTIVQ